MTFNIRGRDDVGNNHVHIDMSPVINPFTGNPLSKRGEGVVKRLRTIRSNARKDARSGHPGRRADGIRARRRAAQEIKVVYLQEINA